VVFLSLLKADSKIVRKIMPLMLPYMSFPIHYVLMVQLPIPVAGLSKEWVCSRSLAGIAGSNPAGAWIYFVSVVCYQIDVSASG
jgi:hypothetical protein